MAPKIGKLTIRFESLKQLGQVRKAAKEARVSLNRYMVDAVMMRVASSSVKPSESEAYTGKEDAVSATSELPVIA